MSDRRAVRDLIRTGWDQTAAAYGQDGTGQFELFGRRLLDLMALPAGATVLDVGTGTGIVAWLASEQAGRVLGVDLSRGMLARAVRTAARTNVGFAQMDAERLGLQGNSFDAVICAFSLFQFVDMGRALAEMARVVRPGGLVGLSNWGPGYFSPVAGMQRDLFRDFGLRAVLTNPLTFEPDILRKMLEKAGLVEVRLELEAVDLWYASPQAVWDYNCSMGPFAVMLREQLSAERREVLRERFLELVGTLASPQGVRCTFHPLYALARKP